LKRSNRLVLLIGILLAVVAFGGVIVLFNQRPTPISTTPTELPTVYARGDIPLGTVVTADMVEARNQSVAVRPADAFGDVGQVVGKTVRSEVKRGQLILPADFAAGAGGSGQDVAHLLDPGLRAIAVQVDQSTGVGTLINVGDRVDLLIGIGTGKFPLVQVTPPLPQTTTNVITALEAGLYNSTTTKVVLQNMQVIGTLVPPPPAASSSGGAQTTTTTNPSLTGQQELVILAVTAQQAEVIKWAQIDGQISLILRSPKDYVDANGQPVQPQADQTSGVVLKTLVDTFGVLPPELVPARNLPTP
jgi:Flp pilus assembly protein CpaB